MNAWRTGWTIVRSELGIDMIITTISLAMSESRKPQTRRVLVQILTMSPVTIRSALLLPCPHRVPLGTAEGT